MAKGAHCHWRWNSCKDSNPRGHRHCPDCCPPRPAPPPVSQRPDPVGTRGQRSPEASFLALSRGEKGRECICGNREHSRVLERAFWKPCETSEGKNMASRTVEVPEAIWIRNELTRREKEQIKEHLGSGIDRLRDSEVTWWFWWAGRWWGPLST